MHHIPFRCFRHSDVPHLTSPIMPLTIRPATPSKTQMNTPTTNTQSRTMRVLLMIWLLVGQTTFFSSLFSSRKNFPIRLKKRANALGFLLASAMTTPFSLRLVVDGMLSTESAILLHFEAVGVVLLVFHCVVIPLLALGTTKRYLYAHNFGTSLKFLPPCIITGDSILSRD